MKALKVTIEIPLAAKSHVSASRKAGEMIEKFEAELVAAGFENVVIEEAVVSRPGRG